ncbi:hypothetical protein GCM10009830_08320 [Glycomyces endophyticus]|uniref:DUF4173 domain-containing protein n=1 Tax=Glycomyces endophyticus TaxID=480996 RepID=A0ABN2G4B6_9ACTN
MSEPDSTPAPRSADEPAGEARPAAEQAGPRGEEGRPGDAPAERPAAEPPAAAPTAEPPAPPAQSQAQPPVQQGVPVPQHERPPLQRNILAAQQPQTPAQYQQQAQYYQQMAAQQRQPPVLLPNPRWHRPHLHAPQPAVVLAFAVALFAAWSAFPGDGVGLGMALTGIALVAVPLATSGRDLLPRLPGAVLVAALWSVAAIRDAGWVVALCTLAAFALTPLALSPQRRIGGTAITVLMGWLEGIAESFRWAKGGRPSKDERNPGTIRMLWTAGVTVCLLLVFGGLFAAADQAFADLVGRLLPDLSPAEVILRLFLAAILVPIVLTWTYMAVARPVWDSDEEREHRVVSRFELAIPMGALNLLFAAFIAVQARVYFGGEDYVMDTAGLTFAEYARRGFWQLSVVAVLALAVIAIAAWLAPKRAKGDRWTVRILLGLLALMSMTVVASATFRMYTYTETFGLTRLRVWIFTVEFWLAVLFALVLVGCWGLRATWLPRAVLASGALTLLGLAAVNPDALIARFNIEHDGEVDLDLEYLAELSADAAPALSGLSDEDRECVMDYQEYAPEDPGEPEDPRDLMAWNWGFQRAQDLAADIGEPSAGCAVQLDAYRTDDEYYYDDSSEDPDDAVAGAPVGEPGTFWHWDTCAMYDLDAVTELFGTAANGDRGVVSDDPSQYAESLDPALGLGDRVLHCGYYGPGTRYLMIDAYEWGTADQAVAGSEAMRAADESEGVYQVSDIAAVDAEATAGYIATLEGQTYQYTEVVDRLVITVTLSDTATDLSARPVCDDLAAQTSQFYYELG